MEAGIARTLNDKPADATRWSTGSLAKSHGLPHATVGRIWQAFRLQPHRQETFTPSTDALLVDKVRDLSAAQEEHLDRLLLARNLK